MTKRLFDRIEGAVDWPARMDSNIFFRGPSYSYDEAKALNGSLATILCFGRPTIPPATDDGKLRRGFLVGASGTAASMTPTQAHNSSRLRCDDDVQGSRNDPMILVGAASNTPSEGIRKQKT